MSVEFIKHKIKGKGIHAHSCDQTCYYCKDQEKAHLVEWTHRNCAPCDNKLECLFQEDVKAMAKLELSQLSINLATMILKEIDPDGELGLEPELDMSTFKAPEPDEVIICEDLFEELPAAGALLLCRDGMHKMVAKDEKGEPIVNYENTFWLDSSQRFKDAAFNIALCRWHKQYLNEETIGASFRLINDKVGITFRPADDIDRAKILLTKAVMKKTDGKKMKGKDLGDLLRDLLS